MGLHFTIKYSVSIAQGRRKVIDMGGGQSSAGGTVSLQRVQGRAVVGVKG